MSENQQQNTQQNSGNLLQVRRDKLKDLQEMGKNHLILLQVTEISTMQML